MPLPPILTRAERDALAERNISDPLANQNTAQAVREVLKADRDAAYSKADDALGSGTSPGAASYGTITGLPGDNAPLAAILRQMALAQETSLAAAQRLSPNIVAGRLYGITGGWNGATTESAVYVEGLNTTTFNRYGVGLIGGVLTEVTVDVAAGTFVPKAPFNSIGPGLQITGSARVLRTNALDYRTEMFRVYDANTPDGFAVASSSPYAFTNYPQVELQHNVSDALTNRNGWLIMVRNASTTQVTRLQPQVAGELIEGKAYIDLHPGEHIQFVDRLTYFTIALDGRKGAPTVQRTGTVLEFTVEADFAEIATGTFTYTTAGKANVTVTALLAAGTTAINLPSADFEQLGSTAFTAGAAHLYCFLSHATGKIQYTLNKRT